MFADYHVHTAFSDDSTYPMEQVVQDAAALGMEEICITDHVDYGVKEDWDSGRPIAYRDGDPLANVDYPPLSGGDRAAPARLRGSDPYQSRAGVRRADPHDPPL